jgi:ribonuclease HI
MKQVNLYTDGSSRGNPGPGGYGAILLYNDRIRQISGGFRLTTNNRMEILGAVVGLCALRESCHVTVYSDSRYLVDAMTKGWLQKWQRLGWKRKGQSGRLEPLKNEDLWRLVVDVVQPHQVEWKWVRGHSGNHYNELCDQLATAAADQPGLPPDDCFEAVHGKGLNS